MVNKREQVSQSEFLKRFAISPDPVLSAPEIADALPISNQAVNKRLETMEQEGLIESKKVGSAAKVYWLTLQGKSRLADLEFDDQPRNQ